MRKQKSRTILLTQGVSNGLSLASVTLQNLKPNVKVTSLDGEFLWAAEPPYPEFKEPWGHSVSVCVLLPMRKPEHGAV